MSQSHRGGRGAISTSRQQGNLISREIIIRQIVNRDLANQDLPTERVAKSEATLYELACEEFGSWETELEYAGVRARGVLPADRPWTRERVLQRLRRLCATGYDPDPHLSRSRKPSWHGPTLRHFGSWRAALTAAGITWPRSRGGAPST